MRTATLALLVVPAALAQSISVGLHVGLPAPTALKRADYDSTSGAGALARARGIELDPSVMASPGGVQVGGVPPRKASRSRARELPVTNAERLRLGLPLKAPRGVGAAERDAGDGADDVEDAADADGASLEDLD